MNTITKIDESTFTRTTVIPEKVIPEQTVSATITIDELSAQIQGLTDQIANLQSEKDTDDARYDTAIANLQTQLDSLTDDANQAINQGLQVKLPVQIKTPPIKL